MNWNDISKKLRLDVIEMSYQAQAAHLASSLSCIDILAVLYSSILKIDTNNFDQPDRDRFILSKGHAATALYAALAWKGIIDHKVLKTYGKKGSLLEEHPSPKQKGVEAATGSLGHGLSIANGMALASKINSLNYNVYVLMSDGECNEGSVWEASMFASQHKFNNLTAIIDYNKWQATGRSQEILNLGPLSKKWSSFGWDAVELDGHDHQSLFDELSKKNKEKPRIIIAHTIKGKGISFMEGRSEWHNRMPNDAQIRQARAELGMED